MTATEPTYIPESPQMDPADAHALLSSLLRRYKRHADHRDMINRSTELQHVEIEEDRLRQTEADEREMAALTEQMRPLARIVLQSDPKHRKSVYTVAGEVCFRQGSERIEVDAAELRAWQLKHATEHVVYRIDFFRTPPPRPIEPDLNGIAAAIRQERIIVNEDGSLSLKGEDGERLPIPGVKLIRAEESFTVRPR